MPRKTNSPLLFFLIILGVAAIGLGYLQIRGAIYAPFINSRETRPPTQTEILDNLKTQDTDKDGLSDFDERFVYQTSAYIADSDSDEFSDQEEIEAHSNPLNPESTPINKLITTEEPFTEKLIEPTKPAVGETELIIDEEISIQQIRDLLVNRGGLSQEIVDKLDDKTLRKLYNETKEETGIDLNKLETPKEPSSEFLDLDIQELRQLLIAQGADPEMLSQMNDETLKLLFLQSLQQPIQP